MMVFYSDTIVHWSWYKMISIGIPTIGRPSLYTLFESIEIAGKNANFMPEVIIADSSGRVSLPKAKVLYNKNGDASNGRNICALNAQNKFILFVDDDCALYPNSLKVISDVLNLKSKGKGFAGLVKKKESSNKLNIAWREAGFDKYFSLSLKFDYLRWAPTACLIVDREACISTKFNDLNLPVGGEDVDFGMRFTMNYGPFMSLPEMKISHEAIEHDDVISILRKAFLYGMSEKILTSIYPQYCVTRDFKPSNNDLAIRLRSEFNIGRGLVDNLHALSLTEMANVYNGLDGRLTFMMIKPHGLNFAEDIISDVEDAGFKLLKKKRLYLNYNDITFLYKDVFDKILADELPSEYIDKHINYLCSNEVLALLAYNTNSLGYEAVRLIRGEGIKSNECNHKSIRRKYPGKGVFNSFHAAIGFDETLKQASYFFKEVQNV